MGAALAKHGIVVPDRQLACAPVCSDEGRAYLAAMAAAANYGRANRHLLSVATRQAFGRVLGTDALELLYDVSHNLAKLETHVVDGRERLLCVHRKGATRALPPGHRDLPPDLADVGQPVLVPGSMGSASYVLVGNENGGAFHSACHGAGRVSKLAEAGVEVRTATRRGLVEEAPSSYKDVDVVAETVERAGLARRIARLVPIGVIKG
jgi:tRNA-splicing ligase RtcB